MLASKSLLQLAAQTHTDLPTNSGANWLWKWFSIVRTYFIVQIIWNLVGQLINQRIKDQTTDLQKLSLAFIFSHRMTVEIWLELIFIQGFELIPVKHLLSPLIVNFSYFIKVYTATNLFTGY